jgi:diacylglycerol O-acyltransferase
MVQQLGEQDATFLYLETPETPQHVGMVSLVELPPRDRGDFFDRYKRHIASRLHLLPMLHQKLEQLPFDIDHPFWVADDRIDLNYHVRRHALAPPGTMRQLEELVGRLHSSFLDRSRPLWEFYVIDGLQSGRIALYTKVHHAAMDGAASQTLIATVYDPTTRPRKLPPPPPTPADRTEVEIGEMLRGMAGQFMRQELRALQHVPQALKAWSKLLRPDAQELRLARPKPPPLSAPATPFNTAITSQRIVALRTLALSRFKRAAKQTEGTVNDVVLAVCAAALRRYLLARGALPQQPLIAMVPVSLHAPGEVALSNQNAAVRCTLATDEADPVRRLATIHDAMRDQKRQLSNLRNVMLPDLHVVGSGALVRGLVDVYRRAKLADRLPPVSNLVISNVPGPKETLYVAGARVLSFYPCSIPFHGSALNITVESYGDALDFGLTACRSTVPDVADLADMLSDALGELERALAGAEAAASAPQRPHARVGPAVSADAREAAAARRRSR